MKQKDIALVLVIAAVSGVLSFVVSGFIFNKPANRQLTAPAVNTISSYFPSPSTKYFNSSSIDPTQLIEIGNSNNPNPFSGSQ
jgi:hypothetical protein